MSSFPVAAVAAPMAAPAATWVSTAGQTVALYAGHAWSAICTAAIAIKTAAVALGLAVWGVAAPVLSYSWGFISQYPVETAVVGGIGIIIGLIAYRIIASCSTEPSDENEAVHVEAASRHHEEEDVEPPVDTPRSHAGETHEVI